MDRPRWYDEPGRQVVHRAFMIAAETGEMCRPIHLLAALAELDGPISDALRPPGGGALLSRPTHPPPVHGGGSGYLAMQTQQAASELATERGESVGPEHLLLAVIDQADLEALALLTQAGLEVSAVRRAALDTLAAPANLPPIHMPPPAPAGTHDRPPLPVGELDPRAWAALRWRQDHLPLERVRRRSHYGALWHLEYRAAWRVASKLGLDDDQRFSLSRHHLEQIERLAAEAKPELVELRFSEPRLPVGQMLVAVGRRRRLHRPSWLNFTVGWGTWFANRQAGLRDRWFRLRTVTAWHVAGRPW